MAQALEELHDQISQGADNLKDAASSRKRFAGNNEIFIVMRPLATALGMSQEDVAGALSKGQTVSSLAAIRGSTVAAIHSAILSSVTSQLPQAVSNGKITQNQATKILQSISSGAWIVQIQSIEQYQSQTSQALEQASQAMKDAMDNFNAQVKSITQQWRTK